MARCSTILGLGLLLAPTPQAASLALQRLPTRLSLAFAPHTNVLVVGGSGRVGGSVARSLLRAAPGARVTIAGRSAEAYAAARERWAELPEDERLLAEDERVSFAACDLEDAASLRAVMKGQDVVIHTAGPFQGLRDAQVLQALLSEELRDAERPGTYVDVCDDAELAGETREALAATAKAKGVTAILSTGTWPGASSLMALELQKRLREEHQAETETLDFNFFTSGSGGAGATVLAATFLILGEDTLIYTDGKPERKPTCSSGRRVLFPGVGRRDVQRLNLLEAWSSHEILGVPNTATRFGTAPFFWNALLAAMARLVPQDKLRDRVFGKALAALSVIPVYAVDKIFGTANAIRVDARASGEASVTVTMSAALAHPDLEACVGEAVHAFAVAASHAKVPAGVFLPEEALLKEDELRGQVLENCAIGSLGGLRFFQGA